MWLYVIISIILDGMVWLIGLYCGMLWYGYGMVCDGMADRSVLLYGMVWLMGLYSDMVW